MLYLVVVVLVVVVGVDWGGSGVDVSFGDGNPTNPWVLQHGCIMEVVGFHWNTNSTLTGTVDFLPDGCNSTNCCNGNCTSCTTTTSSCDTTPASPCAQQWFQNPNAIWVSDWIVTKSCSNYTWPANNLPVQELQLMSNAPNPQTGPYNNASDIWSKANAAWPAGGLGSDKNKFIGKMSKGRYAECQKAACNC